MIINMDNSHIDDVVKLHIESFPDSFLTDLGVGILKVIYQEFPASGFGYVFLDDDQVAGFLAGTFIPARDFYRYLMIKQPIHLSSLLAFAILRSPARFYPVALRAKNLFITKSFNNGEYQESEYEAILRNEAKVAHALTMAVSPDHRRKGIANQLWAYLLTDLPQRGVTSIVGSVISENEPTNRLYGKLGYKKIAIKPRLDGKEEFKWLYYRKGKCTVTTDGYVKWDD